jgi:hypothetical protein
VEALLLGLGNLAPDLAQPLELFCIPSVHLYLVLHLPLAQALVELVEALGVIGLPLGDDPEALLQLTLQRLLPLALALEIELQLGGGRLASLHLQELGCDLLLALGGCILEVVQ